MKSKLLALVMLSLLLALAGCGGDGNHTPPTTEVEIVSSGAVDGYVVEDPVPPFTRTAVLGTPTVLAGVDPADGSEYRSFLHFRLSSIPADATIESATLVLRLTDVVLGNHSVPIQIDLITFAPPLQPEDYDVAPYRSIVITPPISAAEAGHDVVLDVTPLMRDAQSRGFDNLQLRILEDLDATVPGLIEIDESTPDTAPLLRVVYS